MSTINVSCVFDRQKINKEADYEGHLMVSMGATDEKFVRTPVQSILVLDVSGSMNGDSKIGSLRKTAKKLIENLTAKDEVSVITFNQDVEVAIPVQKVGDKEGLYSRIAGLSAAGNTNFSGAILKGLSVVNQNFEGITRIMVLTDGQPTCGILDRDQIKQLVSKRDSKATISFFGFGADCDTELLQSLAKLGGGNYYFIETADDVRNVFARELGGIISCKAQNISIEIKPNKGNKVVEVLNDYTTEEKDGGLASINAEDLYLGEMKKILIKMSLSKPESNPKDRPFSIAHVQVSYDDIDQKKRVEEDINVKVEWVKPDEADKDPKLEVAEQVALLTAAKAQIEAVRLADQGQFVAAQAFYAQALQPLRACADAGSDLAGTAWTSYSGDIPNFNSNLYSREVRARSMSDATGARRGRGTVGQSAELYGNKSMDDMVKNFSEDEPEKPEPKKVETPKVDKGFSKKKTRRE